VGPTADGFETYGVTGVALITFIMIALKVIQNCRFLISLDFCHAVMMIVTSIGSYFINDLLIARPKFGNAIKFNYEIPLTTLVIITR